jgi:hypothetical protein
MYKELSESPATNTKYLLKHHYKLHGANNMTLPLSTNNPNKTSQQERRGWKHTRLHNNSKRVPGKLSRSKRITEIWFLRSSNYYKMDEFHYYFPNKSYFK